MNSLKKSVVALVMIGYGGFVVSVVSVLLLRCDIVVMLLVNLCVVCELLMMFVLAEFSIL